MSDVNQDFPDEVLVEMNLRNRQAMDVYRLKLSTGALTLDTENPGDVQGWGADAKFQVRAAQVGTPDGGTEIRVRDDAKSPWKTLLKVGPDEILEFVDFSADGKSVYLKTSVGSDTARLVQRDLATGSEKVLAVSPDVDAGDVLVQPRTHVVEAVSFNPTRSTWKVIDPSVQADFDAIAKLNGGDFVVVNRTANDDAWLVAFTSDRGPVSWYKWDRTAKKGTLLFTAQPKLEGLPLAEMKPVVIKSRDGLNLNSYLTVPVGVPAEGSSPRPLRPRRTVGTGHLGLQRLGAVAGQSRLRRPAGELPRVDRLREEVPKRGQPAVGSQDAGRPGRRRQVGDRAGHRGPEKDRGLRRLLRRLRRARRRDADAGLLRVQRGHRRPVEPEDPDRLDPAVLEADPRDVRRSDGQRGRPEGRRADQNASPLFRADKISKPLLIGQGANDPRVNVKESEQIVDAIAKNNGSVTYVLYSDEGHGFARPENRIDFNARAEKFLGACLGGRFEPMTGEKIPGSTAVVKVVGK